MRKKVGTGNCSDRVSGSDCLSKKKQMQNREGICICVCVLEAPAFLYPLSHETGDPRVKWKVFFPPFFPILWVHGCMCGVYWRVFA